jgi:endonuclease/exonuclease/phosphatase family metal-dependent hydrolase
MKNLYFFLKMLSKKIFSTIVVVLVMILFSTPTFARLVKEFTNANFPKYSTVKNLSEGKEVGLKAIIELESVLDNIFYENKGRKSAKAKLNNELKLNYITVTQWNLERGLNINLIKKIIESPNLYLENDLKTDLKEKDINEIKSQIEAFRDTDIFVLNEVDWGIPRTSFKNISAEIAESLGAEYIFAPEFIELNSELTNQNENYKGLHGNAIISRYPIKNPRILKLPLVYDWYEEELQKKSLIESARRSSSELTIKESITTELRKGSRIALIADIVLPNKAVITVVNVHLENRTEPEGREKQIKTILESIKGIKNPVILAGDLNNFEGSAQSTSIKRIIGKRIGDPLFISKVAINYFNPYALSTNAISSVISLVRKHRDPTVWGIPIILPNKSREFFNIVRDFKFIDNNKFDFSGNEELSYKQKDGKLSNSNERSGKGFIETYQFKRSFGVAKYKIDWIFIKPLNFKDCENHSKDLGLSCKNYFPAFGRTFKELNHSLRSSDNKDLGTLSDHNPVSTKLMFFQEQSP